MKIEIDITEQNIETIIRGVMASESMAEKFADIYTGIPQKPLNNTIIYNIDKVFDYICEMIFCGDKSDTKKLDEWKKEWYAYVTDVTIPLEVKTAKLYGDILERKNNAC